jgi:flavodoxin
MINMNGVSVLSAYFSHSGNTRVIAYQIPDSVGGYIFEIVSEDPYPNDYDEVVERARKELSKEFRPKLKIKVENMKACNVVFVGPPCLVGSGRVIPLAGIF